MNKKIQALIKDYAAIYNRFEELQNQKDLPVGDQKTGVIGEYYAEQFYERRKGVIDVEYQPPGAIADLLILYSDNTQKTVQVKCVSAHSKTRTIAPINLNSANGKPFDELMLIDLDIELQPIAIYLNSYEDVLKKVKARDIDKKSIRSRIIGAKMKGSSNRGLVSRGSWCIDWNRNLVNEIN
ncbi:MAG: hypothetical protein ACQERC_05520 [Bacteroidota bacterium]